jgi:FAD/FMN-containing dehydrogenase
MFLQLCGETVGGYVAAKGLGVASLLYGRTNNQLGRNVAVRWDGGFVHRLLRPDADRPRTPVAGPM